jgi:hypothetical protein
MSFENRTGLSIGASGTLAGKRFTVVGRVVMSMEDAGETHGWNEFHLVDDAGQSATLVHEIDERGPQWKLFTGVEPTAPLNASEAAARRVGDVVEINGTTARVTMVDESRVSSIEGRAPEGVEEGDVAKYFNAMAGNQMFVVSWTGDEIEIFRGMDLPARAIASAFQLRVPLGQLSREPIGSTDQPKIVAKRIAILTVVGMVLLVIVGICVSIRSHSRGAAFLPSKPPTPAAPFASGASGQLEGKAWRVAAHALIEIRKPKFVYDRHEYQLVGENDTTALLVYGLDPAVTDWHWLRPVELDVPLDPAGAAAKRVGDKVNVSGESMQITELFMSKIRSQDGAPSPALEPGAIAYHFRAQAANSVLLVGWTASGITSYVGSRIPAKDVFGAFALESTK